METKQTALANGNVLWGTFFIGDTELAVDISKQKEIIRMTRITKLPGPVHTRLFEGAVHHRGAVLPVLELRKIFCMPHKGHSADSRIIIIDVLGTDIGIVVDAIGSMYSVPDAAIMPAPGVLNGAGTLLGSIFIVDGRTVSILNTDMLLSCQADYLPAMEPQPQYAAAGR